MTLTQQIITVAMCVLGTMATRFLPFIIFSDKAPHAKICALSGQGPAGGSFRAAGGILPERRERFFRQPRLAGTDRRRRHGGAPYLEKEHDALHRRRYRLLHAAGAACVLKSKPPALREKGQEVFHFIKTSKKFFAPLGMTGERPGMTAENPYLPA